MTVLFAPYGSRWGEFQVCTATEAVVPSSADGFTYAAVEHLEALDAFGTAGAYDRSHLAQLYGGRRVQVLRGWRSNEGRFESVTRLAPYPDATLSRVNAGTMIIKWTAER